LCRHQAHRAPQREKGAFKIDREHAPPGVEFHIHDGGGIGDARVDDGDIQGAEPF